MKSQRVATSAVMMMESLALASRGWWEVVPWQAGPARDHGAAGVPVLSLVPRRAPIPADSPRLPQTGAGTGTSAERGRDRPACG